MAVFDFDKNVERDTLDGVPTDFVPFYTENPDTKKFVLRNDDPAIASALKVITGTHRALDAERDLTKKLKAESKIDLGPLSEFGASPEEIKANVSTRLQELQDAVASGKKIDPVALRAEFAKAHQVELDSRERKIHALGTQFREMLIDQQATMLLSKATDDPELALPHIRSQVDVVEEEGRMRLYVVDPTSTNRSPRHNPATGAPMTLGELIEEMKAAPRFARLFNSETKQGPADPGQTRQPANNGFQPRREDMSTTQMIAQGLKKGQLAPARR